MSIQRIKNFITPAQAQFVMAECKAGVAGIEKGTSYARGLAQVEGIFDIVGSPQVVAIAREILKVDGPLGFLSLTALTVKAGKKGMPGHVDYPHFHPGCPNSMPLAAQFVVSLDGTTGGAAPTWVLNTGNVLELDACEFAAFPGTFMHGVLPNTSNRSRTNLLWSIGPAWVKPMQVALFDRVIDDISPQDLITK